MTSRELTTITRNLQTLYLRGLKSGTSSDFLGYYNLLEDKLSPYEFNAVMQAYKAWIDSRRRNLLRHHRSMNKNS